MARSADVGAALRRRLGAAVRGAGAPLAAAVAAAPDALVAAETAAAARSGAVDALVARSADVGAALRRRLAAALQGAGTCVVQLDHTLAAAPEALRNTEAAAAMRDAEVGKIEARASAFATSVSGKTERVASAEAGAKATLEAYKKALDLADATCCLMGAS